MKRIYILLCALIFCACQQRSSEKEPTVSPVKDSVIVKIEVPKKKPIPKEVKKKELLPLTFKKLSKVFYDSLVVFHKNKKVIDSVTKRDFADTSIIALRGDSVKRDSIVTRFAIRTDYEENFRRFFVRYEYKTSDTTLSTLFYIWKGKSGTVRYKPIQCDCEFKSRDPEILPIEQKDMRAIMEFFMKYLVSKQQGIFLL